MRKYKIPLILVFILIISFLNPLFLIQGLNKGIILNAEDNTTSAAEINYRIINTYPHAKDSFTQGFEYYDGYLYESTGLYGRSSLRKIELKTGRVINKINLDKKYFGEGITILNNKIYQLSWKSNTVFVYDLDFNQIKKYYYNGEGWGLCNNGQYLIMSNGSEFIYFRDPDSFEVIKKIKVVFNNEEVKNINELEFIKGYIYANIWQKDIIIKINPNSGKVEAYLDLEHILDKSKYDYNIDVLNGIAYLEKNDSFLITGKFWPKIFEIKLLK
ncbi:MAG: glutaminyl-peptide cyclotransferase [Halanaerobium sp.]